MIAQLFNGQSKTITSAAIVIGASSLLSRFLGVIRDRLLVQHFTVGPTLDAYYAAFQIPNLLFNFLILGTLSVALLPVLSELLSGNRDDEARKALSGVLTITAVVMGILCLILIIAAPILMKIVAPGFPPDTLAQSVVLTRIMMLSPWLFSMSSVLSTALNATKRFVIVSVAPLVYNASIIVGIVAFSRWWGIDGVAVGVVVGAFLHMAIQWPAVRSAGFALRPYWGLGNPHVRTVGKLFVPRIIGIDSSQVSLFIGTVVGSVLAGGSVALFNLANNIQSVPVGVFGVPYAVAAFPAFASALAERNHERFLGLFSHTVRQILFFLVPLTVFAVVLRAHAVRLIIGTRQLSWDDTRIAAAMVALFAVSFIFQGITPVLSRAFYGLKNTVIPVTISIVSMALNALATWWLVGVLREDGVMIRLLMHWMRLDGISDVRSLALPIAFSLASGLNAFLLWIVLARRIGSLDGWVIARAFGKIVLAALVGGIAMVGSLHMMVPLVTTKTFVGVLGQLLVSSTIGMVVYAIVSLLLRSKEMWAFAGSLHRHMLKITGPVAVQEVEDL